jgi:tRNA(fMet)-specific endonuclease VapC
VAVLIDTSVLVDAERRRGPGLKAATRGEKRAISVVTASELLYGVHRAVDPAVRMRRLSYVERVLGGLEPLAISMHVARTHAEIWARLESEGTVIGAHDLWIAATALAHGMPVVTINVWPFERVAGLEVLAVS